MKTIALGLGQLFESIISADSYKGLNKGLKAEFRRENPIDAEIREGHLLMIPLGATTDPNPCHHTFNGNALACFEDGGGINNLLKYFVPTSLSDVLGGLGFYGFLDEIQFFG